MCGLIQCSKFWLVSEIGLSHIIKKWGQKCPEFKHHLNSGLKFKCSNHSNIVYKKVHNQMFPNCGCPVFRSPLYLIFSDCSYFDLVFRCHSNYWTFNDMTAFSHSITGQDPHCILIISKKSMCNFHYFLVLPLQVFRLVTTLWKLLSKFRMKMEKIWFRLKVTIGQCSNPRPLRHT